MKSLLASWQFWASLSATFAALTAIFAKVGVESVNSDFATFLRTCVVIVVLAGIVAGTGQLQPLSSILTRTYVFLTLSPVRALRSALNDVYPRRKIGKEQCEIAT